MKIFKTGLAAAFVLIFASFAVAQTDAKTAQMMDEVMRKAQDVTSYRVDTKIETQMMGQAMTVDGNMAFKKPNKMRMTTTTEMMGGMRQEIYSTGVVVWTYMPAMKMATKIDMSRVKGQGPNLGGMADASDITKPFEGFPKDKIKYIEKKTVEGVEFYVFEASPAAPGQMPPGQAVSPMLPHKIAFWINADSGLPHKVLMFAEDDSLMMEQTYSNFRINIPIDDSEFEFTPPEGVQVMDMTEGAMNMMRQMQEGQQPPSE